MWIRVEETIVHRLDDVGIDESFTDLLLIDFGILDLRELGGRYVFHDDHIIVRVLLVDPWNFDPIDTLHTSSKLDGILNLLLVVSFTQEVLDGFVEDIARTVACVNPYPLQKVHDILDSIGILFHDVENTWSLQLDHHLLSIV